MKFCAPLSLIIWWRPRGLRYTETERRRGVVVCSWRRVPDETRTRRNHHRITLFSPSLLPITHLILPSMFPMCFFIRRTRSVLVSTCKWLSRTRVPLILLLYIPERYKNETRTRARLIGSRPSRGRTRMTGSE